ncbi:MAG: FAD-dependent 5-carboxymethylaminomethyl-2-thiouridine(34) oxidoreductase MnmC [Comamonas sp.]|nr:FAD-dependent 5-carboxymethylaminomethyl-2-thiouridine(34) oxidoreductase MnmC [Comamonas sp.]
MADGIDWLDDGTPYSKRFGDRYHGEQGALAQAQAVFLQGCGLPQAWAGARQWRILETGFGMGLNFLATWAAWRADAQRPQMLHFMSVEAWPVAASDLLRAAQCNPALEPLARQLHAQYWGLLPGVHRLVFEGGRVLLTLAIGDAHMQLREQAWQADSVYLDGFAPQCNPDIWSLPTLQAVARCCHPGTRLASWTVAGSVREALAQCGFRVEKVPGLPPKRANLNAWYEPAWSAPSPAPWPAERTCIVIGAGLAGATSAASLARRGWRVDVIDAGDTPATGASGLPVGLFGPHLSSDDNVFTRVSRAGVRAMLQQSQALLESGVDWSPSGVLERRPPGKPGLPPGWEDGPGPDWYHAAPTATLQTAGLPEDSTACWHVQAGWVRPQRLVERLLAQPGIHVRLGHRVAGLERSACGDWQVMDAQGTLLAQAPLVVLAAGPATNALLDLAQAPHLPLQPVRGQLSWGPQTAAMAGLPPFPINGNGALVAHVPHGAGTAWHLGSTFDRDQERLPLSPEEQATAHATNLHRLQSLVPSAEPLLHPAFETTEPDALQAWAGVRCTSPDRLPCVGPVSADRPGLWVSTAMGARGLTRAVLCGELLAAWLHQEPLPLDAKLARALRAERLVAASASK